MVIWGNDQKNKNFQVEKFIDFFFKILKFVLFYNYDIINIVGELIICTEELTVPIKKEIKNLGILSRGLFKALASFSKHCLISDKYFEKIYKKLGGNAFFQLTTRNEFKISSSRKLVIDEYIGFINRYASTALVVYCLEYLDDDFINRENFRDRYKSMLYSMDYYINDNFEKIKKRLDDILIESVDFLMNPCDIKYKI